MAKTSGYSISQSGTYRNSQGEIDPYLSQWSLGSGYIKDQAGDDGSERTQRDPNLPRTEDYWRKLGYTGPVTQSDGGSVENGAVVDLHPELKKWLQDKGYQAGNTEGYAGLVDANGKPVADSAYSNVNNDDATFIAGALGLGAAGLAANSAGLGVDAAGNATGGAFGSGAAPTTTTDTWAQTLANETPTNATYATGADAAPAASGTAPAGGSDLTLASAQNSGYQMDPNAFGGSLSNSTAGATTTTAGNTAGSSLADFLSGGGQAKDYIQLGGLVASVAARPKSADTSGINAAAQSSAATSARQQDLAEKQYADQMALLNEYKPLLQQQLQNSIAEQAKSSARSDQQWDDYMKTWRPVEQTLAQKSLDWASPGRMQQAAQEAQSGVATQYDNSRQQQREQMIAAGLDPSTIATIQASQGALEAKDRAGAANAARRTVEQQGMAYLDNAARFGRNMPSTGLAAAGLAGSQGQQAQSGYTGLVNATAAPAATANPIFSSSVSSNNSAGSLYGNAATINNQQSLQNYNQMMGTIAGLNQWYQGNQNYTSSRKTKKVGAKVKGAAAAVEKSGASRWSYKPGMGDGDTKQRMGPMAEDLQAVAPAVSNGKTVDAISLAGLHHAAIGENTRALREQNKRLKRIEQNLSLADA